MISTESASFAKHAYQIHAVSRTRDQTSVRHCVHRDQFLERHRAMEVVDRRVVDGSESSVDLADQLIDARPKVLVLFDILSRRNGQLNQHTLELQRVSRNMTVGEPRTHLLHPFWMLRQENLEALQFLRNTLDVVESVNTDDDLLALKLGLQLLRPVDHMFFLDALDESIRVNADRERPDLSESSFEFDSVRLSLQAQNARAGGEEVTGVVVRVESARQRAIIDRARYFSLNSPDEVTLQDTQENLATDW